jgi:hypothetical protein
MPARTAPCRSRRAGSWRPAFPTPGCCYYAASTLLCVPHALSEAPGVALGAQAGEQRLRQVVTAAGFGRFRRVAQTPLNHIYEARP